MIVFLLLRSSTGTDLDALVSPAFACLRIRVARIHDGRLGWRRLWRGRGLCDDAGGPLVLSLGGSIGTAAVAAGAFVTAHHNLLHLPEPARIAIVQAGRIGRTAQNSNGDDACNSGHDRKR